MSNVLPIVQDINKELFAPQNDVGGKGAYEIVSVAAATAVQNKFVHHNNFQTVNQSVLALAAKKFAEAAGKKDAEAMENWQTVMDTMNKNLATEEESFFKFNGMAENLVKNFPKGGGS